MRVTYRNNCDVAADPSDPKDDTKHYLLFANQTEKNMLLRAELEKVAKNHPDRFKAWYTLERLPQVWKHSSADMIKPHLPPRGRDVLTLICGPPPVIQFAYLPNPDKLG